jgi:hypothetical protein
MFSQCASRWCGEATHLGLLSTYQDTFSWDQQAPFHAPPARHCASVPLACIHTVHGDTTAWAESACGIITLGWGALRAQCPHY